MTKSNVVVFPTDFSEMSLEALQWAKRMAAILDAELHCLYVVEEPHIYATLELGPLPIPTTDELSGSAESQLNTFVADHLKGFSQSSLATVAIGRPADEILNYANEVDAVMIVMATHGHTGLKHVQLGSVTERVVRGAHCAVLVVKQPGKNE